MLFLKINLLNFKQTHPIQIMLIRHGSLLRPKEYKFVLYSILYISQMHTPNLDCDKE